MKGLLNFFVFFLIFSFIGALFSSFALRTDIIVQLDAESFTAFFRENWAVIALVISEFAALLPSKPKGILQAVMLIITKVIEKQSVKQKFLKS